MNTSMKRNILGIVLAFAWAGPAWAEGQPRTITVTGDADVKVVPDEIVLTLGVEIRDKDLNEAKRQNDERVRKVLALINEFKIEPKYVQTDYISMEPNYRYLSDGSNRELLNYVVRKTIAVTLKDTSRFESLLSSALEAGANQVHGIQFRTTELRKYRDQARTLAIKAAKEKAESLTKELGQRVGKPRMIGEGIREWGPAYGNARGGYYDGGYGGGMSAFSTAGTARFPETASTLALGQITINAVVTVSFELK